MCASVDVCSAQLVPITSPPCVDAGLFVTTVDSARRVHSPASQFRDMDGACKSHIHSINVPRHLKKTI